MITEQATVIAVDADSILVETVQQSTCGTCVAQKGCGQGVLAKYLSTSSFFRIDLGLNENRQFSLGDVVELAIDEFAIVRASLWLYFVPLAGLLAGALFGSFYSEFSSIMFALVGLCVGGYLSSIHAKKVKDRPEYAPVLKSDTQNIKVITTVNPIL